MALLRNFERSLSGLVEGTVGRVFRTEVRPTEIARKLAREMEINKRVSLSRTYGPTDYLVYLSPDDRRRYAGVEAAIADEMSAYLLEHARRERLVLVRRPTVAFHTDDRLHLGEFGIEVRTTPVNAGEAAAQDRSGPPPGDPAAPAAPPAPAEPDQAAVIQADHDAPYEDPYAHDPFAVEDLEEHHWEDAPEHPDPAAAPAADDGWLDPVDPWDADPPAPQPPPLAAPGPVGPPASASAPAPERPPAPAPAPQRPAAELTLVVDGTPYRLQSEVVIIGRSRTSDIVVSDPSVSRRHVELRRAPDGWYATDLDSTNGTTLGGQPLSTARRVAPGQRIVVGHADAVIEVR